MATIETNIADANARIHALEKERDELKAQLDEQSRDAEVDLSASEAIKDAVETCNSEYKNTLESAVERIDALEKQMALLKPKTAPVKASESLPDLGEVESRSLDELYAIQSDLPTWQERQAFFDRYISPKVSKEIEKIDR